MIKKKTVNAVGCVVVSLMGLFHASAQEKGSELRNKRITIQMAQKPLVVVFARLIYKYDIAIGFEESTLDTSHDHYFFETNIPPDDFKAQYNGDKQFPSDRGRFNENLITINVENASLEDVMNSIVKQMRNYDWEINNDVVNIFPVRGRDAKFKKLMDTRIREFVLGQGSEVGAIQPLLFQLPEFKRFLRENALHVDFERYAPLFETRRLPGTMSFSNLSFMELLNAITKSKRGGWILQKKKHGTKGDMEFIDILI